MFLQIWLKRFDRHEISIHFIYDNASRLVKTSLT